MFVIEISEAPNAENRIKIMASERGLFDFALNAFKNALPESIRRYEAEEKAWYSKKTPRLHLWAETMKGAGASVEYQDAFDYQSSLALCAESDKRAAACRLLFVTVDAPPEVITAAYRALSKVLHPDKTNGNEEPMKELNNAYDILTK